MYRQILNYVDLFLTERCSLRDLETFLLTHLQAILDSGDKAAIELANSIDGDLVELGEGLVDEAALRESYEKYLRNAEAVAVRFLAASRSTFDHADSSSATIRTQVRTPGQVTDLHLGRVVFA